MRISGSDGRRLLIAAAVLGVGACNASTPTQFTAAHREAIVDSVRTMFGAWIDALNAKDFARAGTFYSSDSAFRWYEDGRLTYTSGQMVRDSMMAMAPGLRAFNVNFTDPRITAVGPGAAVITSEFAEKLTDTTGAIVGYAGALSVSVVHADSGWRLLIGHNSTLPAPKRP